MDNWNDNRESHDYDDFTLPEGKMQPIGYVCQQYSVRLERPVKAYAKWADQIPQTYRQAVLEEKNPQSMKPQDDRYCLATVKHYRSLIPMGQEHRKPIFRLTPADGAIGAHANAVRDAENDFRALAGKIDDQIDV